MYVAQTPRLCPPRPCFALKLAIDAPIIYSYYTLINILYYNPLGCIKEGGCLSRPPYKTLMFYMPKI